MEGQYGRVCVDIGIIIDIAALEAEKSELREKVEGIMVEFYPGYEGNVEVVYSPFGGCLLVYVRPTKGHYSRSCILGIEGTLAHFIMPERVH